MPERSTDAIDEVEHVQNHASSRPESPIDWQRIASSAAIVEKSDCDSSPDLSDEGLSDIEGASSVDMFLVRGVTTDDPAPVGSPIRLSRHPKRPPPSDDEIFFTDDVEGSNLPLRPPKALRASGSPASSAARAPEATFCRSSALAIWREEAYRHPACNQDPEAACTAFVSYMPMDFSGLSKRQIADRILSGPPFKAGEAKHAEVRYILRHCPCSFTQSLREAWECWTHHTGFEFTQERFVSQFYDYRLNEAVERFCQSEDKENVCEYEVVHMDDKVVIVIE